MKNRIENIIELIVSTAAAILFGNVMVNAYQTRALITDATLGKYLVEFIGGAVLMGVFGIIALVTVLAIVDDIKEALSK